MYETTSYSSIDVAQETHLQSAGALAATIDIVACGGVSTDAIVAMIRQEQGLQARSVDSPDAWIDSLGVLSPLTDAAILCGPAHQLVVERWAERAGASLHGAEVLVAATELTVEHAASLTKQGVRALLALPASESAIQAEVGWLCRRAARSHPKRVVSARYRKQFATLTAPEVNVLEAMFEGLTNQRIAEKLSVSLRTVELRRSKIMRKMNATNPAQLIRRICLAGGFELLADEAAGN